MTERSAPSYSRSHLAPLSLHILVIFAELERTRPNNPKESTAPKDRVSQCFGRFSQSGRQELNLRPLRPERYRPKASFIKHLSIYDALEIGSLQSGSTKRHLKSGQGTFWRLSNLAPPFLLFGLIGLGGFGSAHRLDADLLFDVMTNER